MEYRLNVPITSVDEILKLHAGDVVYLTGVIYTARDAAHKRFVDLIKQNNTCKNIEFLDVDGKNHNSNYTCEASKLLNEYLHKLHKLKNKEDKEKLADSIDWDKICEQDPFVMDKIVEFLKK